MLDYHHFPVPCSKGFDLDQSSIILLMIFNNPTLSIIQSMNFCCHTQDPEVKYEVSTIKENELGQHVENSRYYNSLDDVDHIVRENENVSITKVKTQLGLNDLRDQIKKKKEKFTDRTFPPQPSSLGHVEGNVSWKRIPELIKNETPVLFDKKIEPSDVIAGHEGDCYLLSSLAALAEHPDIIKRIFRGQAYNEEGLYKVNLRIDGGVEEVIVDDFVPVYENGLPVFCQPNKKTGEFWVVLLEKALAKVKGSYANLNEGIPSDIFRTVTYASSESLVFSEEHEDAEKVWNLIKQYTLNHYPFCATTKTEIPSELGLEPTHTYTIISAAELEGPHGPERVVKLRNPWKVVDYQGPGNINDQDYWKHLHESPQKSALLDEKNNCEYGLFYMKYNDFVAFFNQIHYCNLNKGGKFLSEEMHLSNKANFFDISVQRPGVYTFELNQAKVEGRTHEEEQEEGAPRSTLVLIKKERKEKGERLEFVNGTMRYNESNTTLTEQLSPGDYVIYAKIDTTFKTHKLPRTATLNLYSKNFATLKPVPRTVYPDLLRKTFLDHAFHNKKNEYAEGKVWISWQLLFQKGGFAYLAVGNDRESNKNVVISYSEDQFHSLHFKLKKPLKGTGNGQRLVIAPGTSDIILVKVINDPQIQSVRFPPKLDMKVEPIH